MKTFRGLTQIHTRKAQHNTFWEIIKEINNGFYNNKLNYLLTSNSKFHMMIFLRITLDHTAKERIYSSISNRTHQLISRILAHTDFSGRTQNEL